MVEVEAQAQGIAAVAANNSRYWFAITSTNATTGPNNADYVSMMLLVFTPISTSEEVLPHYLVGNTAPPAQPNWPGTASTMTAPVMGPAAAIPQGGAPANLNWDPLHQWMVARGTEGLEFMADVSHDAGGAQVDILEREGRAFAGVGSVQWSYLILINSY